jgi:hypothetical protein
VPWTVYLALIVVIIFVVTIFSVPFSFAESQLESPLKQMKHGVLAYNVKCNTGFELILKIHGASPACVKPSTAQDLIQRGWGVMPSTSTPIPTTTIPQSNTTALSPSATTSSYHLVFLLQATASPKTYSDNLDLFAKYLKSGDFLFITGNPKAHASKVLQQTQAARLVVSPGVKVYSLQFYFKIADLMGNTTKLPKGFDYIGYDYEKGNLYSPEFTANETTSVGYFDTAQAGVKNYNTITGSDARFMVTPPYGELKNAKWNWGQAAQHMDTINMQMQGFLRDSNYRDLVISLVSQIRQESPNTQLFVQVSISPARGTVQDNVNAINILKTLPIDGILVFYNNSQTSDLQQLFTLLNR